MSAGGGREGGPGPRPRASDQRRLLAFGTQDTHSINNTHRSRPILISTLEAGSAQTRRAANAPMPMLSRDHFTSRGLLLSSLPIDLALPLSIPSHNDPTSAKGGLDNLPSIPFTSSIPESQFPPSPPTPPSGKERDRPQSPLAADDRPKSVERSHSMTPRNGVTGDHQCTFNSQVRQKKSKTSLRGCDQ